MDMRINRDGYTMVEMLVVLAIIALLMVIVVPQFAFQQEGSGLKGAATELMTALRSARREAITQRELRALALDIYSIPGQFVTMRQPRTGEPASPAWIQAGEPRQLPNNIAVVAILDDPAATTLNALRTDDNVLDGTEDTDTGGTIFNPSYNDGLVNPVYRLIRFEPTGTADRAVIYLWNTTEERREIPSPDPPLVVSNFHTLGAPPGLDINTSQQDQYFTVADPASIYDVFYYTLAVNGITGGVTVYDYAWGDGQWDRKKDGE
jgi:prepilin-type N-terminal cleavage/methylation domain-containing protein